MCGGTSQLQKADKDVQEICDQVKYSSVCFCLHTTLVLVLVSITES